MERRSSYYYGRDRSPSGQVYTINPASQDRTSRAYKHPLTSGIIYHEEPCRMLDTDGLVPIGALSQAFEMANPSTSPKLRMCRRGSLTETVHSYGHMANMNGVDGVNATQCSNPKPGFTTYTMWNVTDHEQLIASTQHESGSTCLSRPFHNRRLSSWPFCSAAQSTICSQR